MRTTLSIDDDVLEEARELAAVEGRSLGAVVSDLLRRSLAPAGIRMDGAFPTFDVAADAPLITSTTVARAQDDE